MAVGFFSGGDWDATLDSLLSAPGAFGNIFVAAIRQVRLFDALMLAMVVGGWLALVGAVVLGSDLTLAGIALAFLPTLLWLAAGAVGGVIFEVGGLGPRVLTYWESYVLVGFFSLFGVLSLRIALNPRDRRVYRASDAAPQP